MEGEVQMDGKVAVEGEVAGWMEKLERKTGNEWTN